MLVSVLCFYFPGGCAYAGELFGEVGTFHLLECLCFACLNHFGLWTIMFPFLLERLTAELTDGTNLHACQHHTPGKTSLCCSSSSTATALEMPKLLADAQLLHLIASSVVASSCLFISRYLVINVFSMRWHERQS